MDPVALFLEAALEEFPNVGFVLDDENAVLGGDALHRRAGLHARGWLVPSAGTACAPLGSGRRDGRSRGRRFSEYIIIIIIGNYYKLINIIHYYIKI